MRRFNLLLLTLQMEGATRQGMQAASSSCKRQDRFSPRVSRKELSPTDTLMGAQ